MARQSTGSHVVDSDDVYENEAQTVEKQQSDDSYFDDDEDVLGVDEILKSEKDMGIIQQMDDVITWSIDGFYTNDENTKRKNRLQLAADPPVFTIKNALGEEVAFYVTKGMSAELAKAFTTVNRGFNGLPEKDDSEKLSIAGTKKWLMENKLAAGLIAFFILFIILSQVISL